VAKLFADLAIEIGNGAKRPLVDHPVKDPRASCQQ
jgi:hypothetical protein